ncbi:beta-phosphoglucomutase [Mycoplasmopsis agassizii]|uniref:Beta-phosphoglucomutase n=2 Tax=Mycoplasmopsis agassizii TaxID=33922 RepID=A0A269TII1_9BACT|nr:beta-phosphoglucomutase [Mycoplasmopsis agassizii]
MKMRKIKGLIFDLDGVITETSSLHYRAWSWTLARYGIMYTEEDNARLKGLSRADTLTAILKLKALSNEFSEEEFKRILKEKNEYYVNLLKSELKKKDILPGMEDLIKKAKRMGLRMAITSSSKNAVRILDSLGLLFYFDFTVDPMLVKKGKPAPDIFLNGVKGLGLQKPQVIGFEDALEGVKGLKAAGLFTVGITHGVEADWENYCNVIVQDTTELNLEEIIKLAEKRDTPSK